MLTRFNVGDVVKSDVNKIGPSRVLKIIVDRFGERLHGQSLELAEDEDGDPVLAWKNFLASDFVACEEDGTPVRPSDSRAFLQPGSELDAKVGRAIGMNIPDWPYHLMYP